MVETGVKNQEHDKKNVKTINDLIETIAQATGLSVKDSEKALNATLAVVKESLIAGEKVVLTGFGTFEVRNRKDRVGHNPRTNEKIHIPAQKSPAFKAGKILKEAVR